ncbi:MAG TPA: glycosyltransferase family 2 protein, partial [Candidatus Hydrogenedentes bacterium]|nr:glycosyltransferase family 2 protein [Candidatus Hydrogenedentota bacterium]
AALRLSANTEIVLVNDGSIDGTGDKLDALATQYPGELRVIHLSRNFGFCAAASAALQYAKGNVVILMDADMQDDPGVFSAFLERWREGYDVVYAVRSSRKDSTIFRLLTWCFYRSLRYMSQLSLPLDSGIFALLDQRVVSAINALPERNRYIPGLRCWVGFNQIGIPVERRPRGHGKSRMGLRGLWDLALMAFFSFSFAPLFVFRLAGMAAMAMACVVVLLSVVLYALGTLPVTWALVAFLIAAFGGINLLGIGVLGEYISLIYDEVRRRPLFLVERVTERNPGE